MEKRIYKLMDAKGRVLIPKELRVETGIGYGDIVALEIADGKVTLRKVTVIEPGDQSPETVDHLCDKCGPYAQNWAQTAEQLWCESQKQAGK